MKKIGIFYGSSTGYTADVANRIAKALGVDSADVYNVTDVAPSKLGDYEVILLGSSTWGDGDVQSDVEDFVDGASALDLSGKKIALFGCGDETMSQTFGNALAGIYDAMKDTGAEFIAPFNTDGYDYEESRSVNDGVSIGLIIDDVNHPDLTDEKIAAWTDEVKAAL